MRARRMTLEEIGARFVNLCLEQREANTHIRSLRCEWRSKPYCCHGMLADPGYAGCAWEKKIDVGPLLEDECCDNCWESLGWRKRLG